MFKLVVYMLIAFAMMFFAVKAYAQPKHNPHRDVWAAIRQVFPMEQRVGARCVVRVEVGRKWESRWRKMYRYAVGKAGEVGPWQFHPGWWKIGHGWNGKPTLFKPWRIRYDALYSTQKAWWLLQRDGLRWSISWPLSARACGLR